MAMVSSLAALAVLALAATAQAATKKPPNFVVIFTDDQDALQNSTHPRYMPNLHQHIRYPGVELERYFVTTPVCCPSRTNLWRGQFAHNTNFTDVLGPHGGYSKWKSLGIDKSYLPVWLQELGYNTYYVGKFLVDYSATNYKDKPAGWTDIDALITPYMFDFNTPGFSRNGAEPNIYPGEYSNDVVADKAVAQIKSAVASGKPFFAQISPIAPHSSTIIRTDPVTNRTSSFFYPPIPAPRHWELFSDATLPEGTPRKNLYESNVADKPLWIRNLPLAAQNNRTYLEEVYRLRLRSLASVDELIGRVVAELNASGVLDNTYLIYSSDNGYHVGTHRFGAGKVLAYEEELRVPFLIRGPGIKASQSTQPANGKVGLHVDFAPTILSLAGGSITGKGLDGTPLPLYDNDDGTGVLLPTYPKPEFHRNQFQGEFWGGWGDELLRHIPRYPNNTWKAVRVYDEQGGTEWKLIVSCTNEREVYNLARDKGELVSVHRSVSKTILNRLEALLAVLVVCKEESCYNPWKVLHPDGSVKNWQQSLDKKYDALYAAITPFRYVQCRNYQLYENEVSQFRTQLQGRRLAETSSASVRALRGGVFFSESGAGEKLSGNRRAAMAGTLPVSEPEQVTIEADIEARAVPIPEHVKYMNYADIYTPSNAIRWA